MENNAAEVKMFVFNAENDELFNVQLLSKIDSPLTILFKWMQKHQILGLINAAAEFTQARVDALGKYGIYAIPLSYSKSKEAVTEQSGALNTIAEVMQISGINADELILLDESAPEKFNNQYAQLQDELIINLAKLSGLWGCCKRMLQGEVIADIEESYLAASFFMALRTLYDEAFNELNSGAGPNYQKVHELKSNNDASINRIVCAEASESNGLRAFANGKKIKILNLQEALQNKDFVAVRAIMDRLHKLKNEKEENKPSKNAQKLKKYLREILLSSVVTIFKDLVDSKKADLAQQFLALFENTDFKELESAKNFASKQFDKENIIEYVLRNIPQLWRFSFISYLLSQGFKPTFSALDYLILQTNDIACFKALMNKIKVKYISFLMDKNAEKHHKTISHFSFMLFASIQQNTGYFFNYLMDYLVEPNISNKDKTESYSILERRKALVEIINQVCPNTDTIIEFYPPKTDNDNVFRISKLLEDAKACTLLHYVSMVGKYEMLSPLISAGAVVSRGKFLMKITTFPASRQEFWMVTPIYFIAKKIRRYLNDKKTNNTEVFDTSLLLSWKLLLDASWSSDAKNEDENENAYVTAALNQIGIMHFQSLLAMVEAIKQDTLYGKLQTRTLYDELINNPKLLEEIVNNTSLDVITRDSIVKLVADVQKILSIMNAYEKDVVLQVSHS